ncbi:hypothetical protein ACA373_09895 [Erwinia sp. STN24]
MTKREKCFFILNVILPMIDEEGMTIKTRCDGELTLSPNHPAVQHFVRDYRQHLTESLRNAAPASPYGI